jgi:predicted alpha/beta superfamily hydrolase
MRRQTACAIALLGLIASARPLAAQDEPISIGVRTTVRSAVLEEDREILISTPANYAQSRARCPVMYVLDGTALFLQAVADARFLADLGMAPDMIVVGVSNAANRGRDLTPETTTAADLKEFPAAGGAARFRQFLVSELRPFIEGRYRVETYRILVGWSLGGLFAIDALLEAPDAFDAYIAISPSLWWDNEAEAAKADRLFAPDAKLKKFLYLTHGREYNGIPKSVQWFTRMLGRKAPAGLRWTFAYLPTDNHGSSPRRALYDALENLFDGWAVPEDSGIPTPGDLEARYERLTERFGFQCRPSEGRINGMAYSLLRQKKIAEAAGLFEYVVRTFPDSPNAYDSLADAFEAAGKLDLALRNCQTACRLGREQGDSRLETFKKHLDSVTKKLAGGDR